MEILDLRFIFVIITFAIIGIVCIVNRSKIGLTAASFSVVAALVIWGVIKINIKMQNILKQVGLTFKDVLAFLVIILMSILIFMLIFLFLKIFNKNKGIKKR